MGSSLTKVYTHKRFGNIGADDPNRAVVPALVRRNGPTTPYIVDSIWPEHPKVANEVRKTALRMAVVASAVLGASDHSVEQDHRSYNPRIELRKGDRTDWYVLLVVGPNGKQLDVEDISDSALSEADQEALGAAWSIEYGRRSFNDSTGRRQPTLQGVGALRAALAAA